MQKKHLLTNLLKQAKVIGYSLKLLWQSAPRETLLLAFCLAIQGLIPALTLITFRESIHFLTNHITPFPWFIFALWAVVLFFETLFEPILSFLRLRVNEKILAHFNILLMKKANDIKGLGFLENKQSASELKQLRDEVRYRPINLIYILTSGVREWIGLVSVLVLLSTAIWWLPFLILIAALPNAISTMWREKQAWEYALLRSPESQQMSALAQQTLDLRAAKEIRLFGFGDFLIKKYQAISKDFQHHMSQNRQALFARFILLSLPSILGDFLIFYLVISHAMSGLMKSSEVVMAVQGLITVQRTIGLITQNLGMFSQVYSFFDKFRDFIQKTKSDLFVPRKTKTLSKIHGDITFENVTFAYHKDNPILKNINLKLKAGETIALVGENGAGKSTLVKLLCRFYDPNQGTISVDGTDLKELDLPWWYEHMSCVLQDFAEYPMTIRENIGIGNWKKMEDTSLIEKAAQQGGLHAVHFNKGYDTLLGKPFGGTTLSGGEWQKIAVSRAFMRPANFLILDEPTASLDARSEQEVFHSFSKLSKGKTSLLITHRLGSVSMADRILVMKQGEIIEDGTHQSLLQKGGEYASLYQLQTSNYTLNR